MDEAPPSNKGKMKMGRPKKYQNENVAMVVVHPESEDKPIEREPRDVNKFLGVAAQLAKSTVYCGNWKFKNAEKHFPHAPLMRTVDKYFPYANGGPLFVDQPVTEQDETACQKKAKAMKQEGQRYVYITKDMNLEDALVQMKENGF